VNPATTTISSSAALPEQHSQDQDQDVGLQEPGRGEAEPVGEVAVLEDAYNHTERRADRQQVHQYRHDPDEQRGTRGNQTTEDQDQRGQDDRQRQQFTAGDVPPGRIVDGGPEGDHAADLDTDPGRCQHRVDGLVRDSLAVVVARAQRDRQVRRVAVPGHHRGRAGVVVTATQRINHRNRTTARANPPNTASHSGTHNGVRRR
jgi:hypothetical protein